MTPFDQILARLFSGTDAQPEGSKIDNKTADSKKDKDHLTAGDFAQLEGILAAWIQGLQQVQSISTPSGQTAPLSIQQVNAEGQKALVQWLQKNSQSLNVNQNTLLDSLALQINQWKTQLNVNGDPSLHNVQAAPTNPGGLNPSFVIPMIKPDKLQANPSLSVVGSQIQQVVPMTTSSNENDRKIIGILKGIGDQIEQLTRLESNKPSEDFKLDLILDKNPATLSKIAVEDSGTHSGGDPIQPSANTGEKDKTNSLMLMGLNLGNEGTNALGNAAPSVPPVISASQFVPEVSDWISQQIQFSNNPQGLTEAKFSLYPEHLGHMEIKITSQEGQISAQIITDTLMGKDVLQDQLHQLKDALQQQGLLVQKLDVSYQVPPTTDANSTGFSFSDGGFGSFSGQSSAFSSSARYGKQGERDSEEVEKENPTVAYGVPSARSTSAQIDFRA